MDAIFKLIDNMNEFLWSYILIVMLITLGLYFTFRTKFVQFRYFGEMFKLLGDGTSKEGQQLRPGEPGVGGLSAGTFGLGRGPGGRSAAAWPVLYNGR